MKCSKIVRQNLTILEYFFMVKYSLDFKLSVVKDYYLLNVFIFNLKDLRDCPAKTCINLFKKVYCFMNYN